MSVRSSQSSGFSSRSPTYIQPHTQTDAHIHTPTPTPTCTGLLAGTVACRLARRLARRLGYLDHSLLHRRLARGMARHLACSLACSLPSLAPCLQASNPACVHHTSQDAWRASRWAAAWWTGVATDNDITPSTSFPYTLAQSLTVLVGAHS